MIQSLALNRRTTSRRGLAAALLVVVLNFALVPCTMAIEVVEEGHDCCPPELRLEAAECCAIDDGNVSARSGTVEFDEDGEASSSGGYVELLTAPTGRNFEVADPPDPPLHRPALNVLHCVFLK